MKEIAAFFKALADETRFSMIWLLMNHRELCVCDLMEALGITQSKASRHLATLRHAGLVSDRKDGTWAYYSLRPPDGTVEAAILEAIRTGLARLHQAERVLQKLRACMECRYREAAEKEGKKG